MSDMGGHRIIREIQRPAPDVVEGLGAAGVTTVYEARGRQGLLPARLRPLQAGMTIAGPVVTVSLPPDDNLMIHAAVECCVAGDVLLVVPTAPSRRGMVGELLATSLVAHGVVGLVIDAGVRDVAALRAMGFPVWSAAISSEGTTKAGAGSVNVPVRCGRVAIHPGDVLVADDDGVVVVPVPNAASAMEAARERVASEDSRREQFAAGTLGIDLYGLRTVLADLGVTTSDRD
jgi:4-hydroxy-4-methyl-2-oxoglutarate aldolase